MNSSGNSPPAGSPYFSASFIIASCTISSAASASRTAYCACLKARRSTPARKSESSWREATKRPLRSVSSSHDPFAQYAALPYLLALLSDKTTR